MALTTSSVIHTLSSEPSARTRFRQDVWIAFVIWALCLLIYNANMRLIAAADTYPARYLPFGLWRYHTVVLDPIATITAQGRKFGGPRGKAQSAFWMVQTAGGQEISLYPVTIPVLLAPLYAPAVYYLYMKGWEQWRLDWVARIMEKLSASLIASTSAALLYLLLRRRAGPRLALLLTFAYALGTNTWMIGSQALWQHGMSELLIVGMLVAVTGPCTTRAVCVAGVLGGLIACNRPPDSLLAAAIGLYGLRWAGRKAPLLIAGALIPGLLLLAYNFGIAGHWAGGYGLVGKEKKFFRHNPVTGTLGLLFSPARGLFFYSPFLLFIPLFAARIFRERSTRFLTVAMSVSAILLIATYAKTDWRQGVAWGPRWLTSFLPILIWMLPPIFYSLLPAGRVVFVATCVAGVAMQAIGAFWYTGASDAPIFAIRSGPGALQAAWDPRNAPVWTELQHSPASAELTTVVRGSLDLATTTYGEPLNFADGKEMNLEGWALANGQTPSEVFTMLDGKAVASTHEFLPRPDVTKTLGVPFASGWRLRVPARDIDPGKHVLGVFVRAVEGGEAFFLVDAKFVVTPAAAPYTRMTTMVPPDVQTLSARARQAATLIASRQDAQGYWLTAFTKAPSYQRQRPEMNTYLNAVMTDLLAPIAREAQLEENVSRVRRYLAAQIEDGGLVRYHGRPDSSVIGKLGCAITPDADDTALVWRVAPIADRRQLPRALSTLHSYQTPNGLYRTWLSPTERYQCLDPGTDPNPADAGIQMHIFMLLATEDPPSARALCRNLAREMATDRTFVYYRNAPIIPMLRQADLHNAGCRIELPASLLSRTADGQQEWIAVARLLQRFVRKGAALPSPTEVRSVLDVLSRNDFALLRQSPPLLYHNDQTASVKRFYWSEDAGYSLWLRLYFENERAVVTRRRAR